MNTSSLAPEVPTRSSSSVHLTKSGPDPLHDDPAPAAVIDLRAAAAAAVAPPTVAVLGLGYVGLPTVVSLGLAGHSVIGIDPDVARLGCIRDGAFDGPSSQHSGIEWLLAGGTVELVPDTRGLGAADGVVICVPTPVSQDRVPDLEALRGACASVVACARSGQTIVLTSTTYPGCTRDLLVDPLEKRGLRVGTDIHVAFSPERIDPGNTVYSPEMVPRIVGGHTPRCTEAAAALLIPTAAHLHEVASTEVAEFAKLFENVFRAVNIALANELSDTAEAFGLDPMAVIEAAATKPYGFMRFDPGPGVGGHCIPVDPHYLLARSASRGVEMPLVREAMQRIDERPRAVVQRVLSVLGPRAERQPRVLVIGAAYKPGVADVRESPAIDIMRQLRAEGIAVSCHDPVVTGAGHLPPGVRPIAAPSGTDYDLCLVLTVHPGFDYEWLADATSVLDMTFGRHVPAGERCR